MEWIVYGEKFVEIEWVSIIVEGQQLKRDEPPSYAEFLHKNIQDFVNLVHSKSAKDFPLELSIKFKHSAYHSVCETFLIFDSWELLEIFRTNRVSVDSLGHANLHGTTRKGFLQWLSDKCSYYQVDRFINPYEDDIVTPLPEYDVISTPGKKKYPSFPVSNRKHPASASGPRRDVGNNSRMPSTVNVSEELCTGIATPQFGLPKETNVNPGDDVMGKSVPEIVSVAESVLSTVGDNVDKTSCSPDVFSTPGKKKYPSFPGSNRKHPASASGPRRDVGNNSRMPSTGKVSGELCTGIATPHIGLPKETNVNPGDDVMGKPVPAIVSVAESVLSTVGDNVDETSCSPDPSHNKGKIAPVVSVSETHDANANDGVITLASSEKSDHNEDVATAERMKLRNKFNIPMEGLITDNCLHFLNRHYYFLDGATQVMHPTAAMVLGRAAYLKFPEIAKHWYDNRPEHCTTISYEEFVFQINNARITFTDSESMSHIEGKVMADFLQQNGTLNMVEVMIKASDNGSLLRDPERAQLWELAYEIATNVTGKDSTGHHLNYKELCEPYCGKNDPFYALLKLYEENMTDFSLTYPTVDIMGKHIFIANNLYDVQIKSNTSHELEGFNTVILRYFMVHSDVKVLLSWENELVHVIYESDRFPLLKGGVASDTQVAKEVRAMGTRTAPLLALALALLMVFLVVCSFRYNKRESKPIEALLGGAIPILAGLTTVGMVSASGLAFQSIVVSSLFLLLAIGIDDVFIMLSAWHRTDRTLDIPLRVAEMVKESGCSMTVTSVTNLVSFGNGVLSTTPVLQTFAIYSSVASVVCFLYQLILFPAIITLTATNEYKKHDDDVSKSCLPEEIKVLAPLGVAHDRFWKKLARVVTHPLTAVLTVAVLIAYWSVAAYGISIVKTDLSVQKLAPADARIVQFKNEYDRVVKAMQTVGSVVTHPGDLRDAEHLKMVKNIIHDFETATYSYGNESTFFFLPAYFEYMEFYEAEEDGQKLNFTYEYLPAFLEMDTYWKPTVRIANQTACFENQPECLDAFLFTTGFTTVVRYNEMFPLVTEWRDISAKYPDLGIYSYTERSNYADQTQALSEVIWQTLLSEVISMGFCFLVFVPDTDSILAAMFSLLSVNMGVFGFLSLWDVGVDPVSMAALLMSIGFSVDISAHISYHYYTVDAPTARERLEDAFLHIGWPTVQGGMSTLLAMLAVLLRPSYLGMVFLKAVFLVIVFGLIHGIIVLPVFLSLMDKIFGRCRKRSSSPLSDRTSNSDSTESSIYTIQKQIQPHRISIKSFTN